MRMSVKDELHHLVDQLAEEDAIEALAYIRQMLHIHSGSFDNDPLGAALADAPIDDEPETDEERAAVARAKAELTRGEGVPAAEVFREFGV
jgi:hypothetical protein